ncbi:WD-40 repeat protein, partial [Reticulomyxa filosa]
MKKLIKLLEEKNNVITQKLINQENKEEKKMMMGIDYASLNGEQYLCSGSRDKTVCVWNVKTRQLLKCFKGHSSEVDCAKFSPYHYYNHHRSVICSSSDDKIIRFWDFDIDKEFQTLNGHSDYIYFPSNFHDLVV